MSNASEKFQNRVPLVIWILLGALVLYGAATFRTEHQIPERFRGDDPGADRDRRPETPPVFPELDREVQAAPDEPVPDGGRAFWISDTVTGEKLLQAREFADGGVCIEFSRIPECPK